MPSGQPSHIRVSPYAGRQVLTDLGLLNEATYQTFIKRYPDFVRKNYIVTRESQGALKYTPNKRFYHWTQKGKNVPMFKATADVAAAAGATATVTVAAGYYQTSGKYSSPAPGHYYMNDTNGQLYYIVSKSEATANAHTIVIRNVLAAQAIAIDTEDALIFKPTIVGEASGSQEGIYRVNEKLENYCATIKSTKSFSDWNLFEKIDTPGYDNSWKAQQMADEYDLFLYQQEQLLMFIDQFDNVPGVENKHRALIPLVKAYGQIDQSSTEINSAFFQSIARLIDAEGYSWEYDGLFNINFGFKWEDYLRSTYGGGGGIVWAQAFNDGPMQINDSFNAYKVNGVKFNWTNYHHFSSAALAGAAPDTGYYNNAALMIPRGFGVTPDGTNVPRFAVRWQGENAQDPIVRVRPTGGLAPTPTDDTEKLVISHITHKGIDPFGLNGYMWIQPNF